VGEVSDLVVQEHAVVLGAPHRGPQVHHRRQHSCPAEPNTYARTGDLRHSSQISLILERTEKLKMVAAAYFLWGKILGPFSR
jgi:hypothetical protein